MNTLTEPATSPAKRPRTNPRNFPTSKRGIARLTTGFLVIAALAMPLSFTGCAGVSKPTSEAVRYFTLQDTRLLVDAAERSYGDAVALGKITSDKQMEIDSAIVKFHAGFKLAVLAAKASYTNSTPEDVQAQADALVKFIFTFVKRPAP